MTEVLKRVRKEDPVDEEYEAWRKRNSKAHKALGRLKLYRAVHNEHGDEYCLALSYHDAAEYIGSDDVVRIEYVRSRHDEEDGDRPFPMTEAVEDILIEAFKSEEDCPATIDEDEVDDLEDPRWLDNLERDNLE